MVIINLGQRSSNPACDFRKHLDHHLSHGDNCCTSGRPRPFLHTFGLSQRLARMAVASALPWRGYLCLPGPWSTVLLLWLQGLRVFRAHIAPHRPGPSWPGLPALLVLLGFRARFALAAWSAYAAACSMATVGILVIRFQRLLNQYLLAQFRLRSALAIWALTVAVWMVFCCSCFDFVSSVRLRLLGVRRLLSLAFLMASSLFFWASLSRRLPCHWQRYPPLPGQWRYPFPLPPLQ